LIVFDCTKDLKENRLAFWINSIKSRAPNSMVYFIGTHFDKLPKKTKEQSLKDISLMIEQMWNDLEADQSLRYFF